MKWPDQTAISVTFDGWHWRHAPYVEDVAQPGDEISPHLGDEADSACPDSGLAIGAYEAARSARFEHGENSENIRRRARQHALD